MNPLGFSGHCGFSLFRLLQHCKFHCPLLSWIYSNAHLGCDYHRLYAIAIAASDLYQKSIFANCDSCDFGSQLRQRILQIGVGTSAVQGAGTNIRFDAGGQIWLSYNLFNFDIQGRPNVIGKWDSSNASSFELMAQVFTQSPTSALTRTGDAPVNDPVRRWATAGGLKPPIAKHLPASSQLEEQAQLTENQAELITTTEYNRVITPVVKQQRKQQRKQERKRQRQKLLRKRQQRKQERRRKRRNQQGRRHLQADPRRSGSGSPTAGPTALVFSLVFPGGEEYVPSNPVPAECFPGMYKNGDFRCKECPMGKSSHAKNQARCVECGIGTYADAEGQAACTHCPTGSTTWEDGAISEVQCMCEQDYFDKAIRYPLFNISGCKSTRSEEFIDCKSAKETELAEMPPDCAPLGDLPQMDLQVQLLPPLRRSLLLFLPHHTCC